MCDSLIATNHWTAIHFRNINRRIARLDYRIANNIPEPELEA